MSGTPEAAPRLDELLRPLVPPVLGSLTRASGRFDLCEDAVQEALIRAARRWPAAGVPDNPRGWLLTVASRVLIDELRSEASRRHREASVFAATPPSQLLARPADAAADPDGAAADRDDSLKLLFLCCHPALTVPSQIALTLRAVGGLTTVQIAAAFLVSETAMAQRISRAKAAIRAAGLVFELPRDQVPERLDAVRHVLYLVFNEGYTASTGEDLLAPQLSQEAIRLARMLRRAVPDDGETAGLLALMLLTDARRPARTRPDGGIVPLAEQDRSRWSRPAIAEGTALLAGTLPHGLVGPFQLQAAIAAVHDEAPSMAATDWPQILGLYDLLTKAAPNPVTSLNRAVALAMVCGPAAGLAAVADLAADGRLAGSHRLYATRAHLRELDGDAAGAARDYLDAARRTANLAERRYLAARAQKSSGSSPVDVIDAHRT